MSPNHVRVDLSGSIATITLDRPEQKNALFGTMREDLLQAIAAQLVCFDSADFDEGLRAFLEKRPPRFIGA